MNKRVSVVLVVFGVAMWTSVAAAAQRFYDLTLFRLDLPTTTAFSTISDNPRRPFGVSFGVGVKSPLKTGGGKFVITPGIALRLNLGGETERLFYEWAYAHTDVLNIAIQPSLAMGWQANDQNEFGLECAYYDFKVKQGFERWSHTNYLRDFRARGIGLSIYYRSEEFTLKLAPYTKLDCGAFGQAGMAAIAVTVDY